MSEIPTNHSTADLLSDLRERNVDIRSDGEQIRFSAPRGVLTPELKELLAAHKGELLQLLRSEPAINGRVPPLIALPRPAEFPLSFAQQRLWLIDQLQINQSAYNIGYVHRLHGALDVHALQSSLVAMVQRHEPFRTVFIEQDGVPRQVIQTDATFTMNVIDLSSMPAAEREPAALQLAQEEAQRPFDLAADLMLRAQLLRLTDSDHLLTVTMHHIASDGWSNSIFWRELAALYAAFVNGDPSPLSPLPIQYADYAVWQRQWLQGEVLEQQMAYWRRQLTNLTALELPSDRTRPATHSYQGKSHRFTLAAELVAKLRTLARREGVTLYMTLLAAFQVLLHRYSGQSDIVVGSPIANRTHIEIEKLIGFFVNTLVLRGDLSGNPTFCELLQRVRHVALDAYDHQDLPFEKLVEELEPDRHLNRNPFFQVMFQLKSGDEGDPFLPGLGVERLPLRSTSARIDLELNMHEVGNTLSGSLIYSTDLYDAATIERLVGHFQVLLEGIAADPTQTIGHLPLLTLVEQHQILEEFNQTNSPYPRDTSIQQLFYDQAARSLGEVAVIFGDRQLTYRDLNHRSNQLARYLVRLGVLPGDKVGVLIDKSVDLVTALLAILKAGAAYVPLNPLYPHERLRLMTCDAGVSVVLSHVVDTEWLSAAPAVVVRFDQEQDRIAAEQDENLEIQGTGDSLAYVMYTSGTTGQPKGIAIPHRAIVRLVKETNYIEITPSDIIAQASTPSFDAATFEIWGALLNGAQLVGVDTPTLLSAIDLDNTLRQRGMTVLFVTTALFNQLAAQRPDVFKTLRCLLFGGQAVLPHWVREVCTHGPPRELHHVYGPTESTTFASFQRVEQAPIEGATVPIGRPVSNTQILILDPYLNPVPVGVIGELCIGGDGLASGYLNQPALTAEKFIPHPFQSGERLYRTGDLARYLPDGAIEFVGRRDRQVKIRGYRVELEEVDSALRRCAALSDAVVIEQREGEEQRLVAYLVAGAGDRPTVEQLRSELAAHLPAYMLPAAYVFVDRIPLTVNGKTDVRALLVAPSQALELQSARTAAHNVLELQLVRVWEDVLDIRPIGVHDNFFDLGGHSLLGVRLFHRIEQEFGVRLPLALLFSNQTVAELARHLEQPDSAQEWRTLISIQPGGGRPPFFCVHGFGGGVLGYADLARLLGPDQPFYGLQAAGLDGDEAPDLTVAAMATRYIAAMRSVQARGPYRIGGYCFGGVVAFEMARQLELQGDALALLAIMEGYAPSIHRQRAALLDAQRVITIWRNLPYWLEDYWRLGAHGINLRVQRKVRVWRKRLTPHPHPGDHIDLRDVLPDDLGFVPDHHRRLMEIHLAALRNYQPQSYGGAVTLFSARGRTISNALSGSLDPQRGWGALALGGATVHPVDGGHRNIHLPPYVASLAAALTAALTASL